MSCRPTFSPEAAPIDAVKTSCQLCGLLDNSEVLISPRLLNASSNFEKPWYLRVSLLSLPKCSGSVPQSTAV